jgi:dCTP deaminase
VQVTRLTPTAVPRAAVTAPRTTRRFAQLKRAHQVVKALTEQLVDLGHHATQLCAIKMTLHHVHHVLNQQVALDLHDGGRVRPHEKHDEVITRLGIRLFILVIKLRIVKSNLDCRTGLRQLVEVHAHFVQHLTKIIVARHGPAHLEQVFLRVKLDAGFVFIRTVGRIRQRARSRIPPQRLEGILHLRQNNIGAQDHLTMDMNFKRSVVAWHELNGTRITSRAKTRMVTKFLKSVFEKHCQKRRYFQIMSSLRDFGHIVVDCATVHPAHAQHSKIGPHVYYPGNAGVPIPMAIKSDKWIRRMAESTGMIEPFEPGQIRERDGQKIISYGTSSYGYDIRCAPEFKVFTNIHSTVVDPKNFDEKSFVDFHGDSCIIPPNSFALARTVEYFRIPRNVLTICLGKSTYARCGIIVNVTPFEPEWEGYVTLEFSNTTPLPARIYAGEGCAQVLFFESDEVCETSYKDRGGKYQGQVGVTLPRA